MGSDSQTIAKWMSGADAELETSDFAPDSLREIIKQYKPRILAFTSKRAAEAFFGTPTDYGLSRSKVGDTSLFTLTSPYGLAAGHWQDGRYWKELSERAM